MGILEGFMGQFCMKIEIKDPWVMNNLNRNKISIFTLKVWGLYFIEYLTRLIICQYGY